MKKLFAEGPFTPGGVRGALRAFCFYVMASILAGCVGSQPTPMPSGQTDSAELAVIGRDWHTEIALSTSQVSGPLATLDPMPVRAKYLIVGFGDRAYFSDHDAGADKAFFALFPGPSAVQLATVDTLPEDENHTIVRLRLSPEALDRIVAFIWNSLDRSDGDKPSRVTQYGQQNVFYAGRQSYDSFYNCNTWIADALQVGGLPFDSSGVLFASQVMTQAQRVASMQAPVAAVKMTGGQDHERSRP
ncbi:DUF2459 domain-containing protein [Telmatospirillum sp.]|uniref:DUF2459 domain-containing protein n=1 Tax=Telmatospirillum sp. TaxID=2079197 RepID=UPI00283BE6E7|nr:DUF2459 domain-containing protein [Telmatospirillum sp.]MDR3436224.1 DUF2459 domain-containing protein [Telmatospirillum sp.]